MEHMNLGILIVAEVCSVGLIQLIMWIVVVIRHPRIGDLRLDLVKTASPQTGASKAPQETGNDKPL